MATQRSTTEPAQKKPAQSLRRSGSDLVPDFARLDRDSGGTFVSLRFWVGVTPDCPVEGVTLGAVNFPKLNERLVDKPNEPGKKVRVPVNGAIQPITPAQMATILDALPRTVIRFRKGYEQTRPGLENVDKEETPRGRRGFLITIPSEKQKAEAIKAGRAIPPYTPSPHDEPVAKYLYAWLCENQERPTRLDYLPETLDKTGLEWPSDLPTS